MSIVIPSPGLEDILGKLTPKEKETLWNCVAVPATKRARSVARKKLTARLVEMLEKSDYVLRIKQYRDIFDLLLEPELRSDNGFSFLVGEIEWLNCQEDDRPRAVMEAIKQLNKTIKFKLSEGCENEEETETITDNWYLERN